MSETLRREFGDYVLYSVPIVVWGGREKYACVLKFQGDQIGSLSGLEDEAAGLAWAVGVIKGHKEALAAFEAAAK